jgi:2'-5' RNA ligase
MLGQSRERVPVAGVGAVAADGEFLPAEQAALEQPVTVGRSARGEHDEGVPFGNLPAVDVGQAGGSRRRRVGVIADPGFGWGALVDGRDEPPFRRGRLVGQGDVFGRVEASAAALTGQEAAGLPGVFGRDVFVDGANESLRDRHASDPGERYHAVVLGVIWDGPLRTISFVSRAESGPNVQLAVATGSCMGNRLFVSVDLDGLAEAVADVQDLFADASGLNVTDPDQAHVTLFFLGDTDPARLDEITATLDTAVAEADVDPFTAEFGGLGVFPSLEYISVVWLGVESGDDQLTALHEAIVPRLVELGFEPPDHEFTPHATLARMEHAGGKDLVQDTVRERDPTAGQLRVDEVRLTESVLTDAGPEYHTVERFEL